MTMLVPTCGVAQSPQQPRLQGTFIQLLHSHTKWTPERWARLFASFRQLQLSQLVVQWTVHDQSAFFSPDTAEDSIESPLQTILRMADASGMQVLVGLVHDPGYWSGVSRPSKDVEVYLRKVLSRSALAAVELVPVVTKYRSFAGWYIPQEIDDVNWQDPASRRPLFNYLRTLGGYLRLLTPDARIALSGFSNANMSPRALESFWINLLQEVPTIDLVLFQDGIGAGKLQLSNLPSYAAAVRTAADTQGRELRAVVEVYRQVAGRPFDKGDFRAVPAPLKRILSQLEASAPYSSGNVAFSVPEYLSPLGGPAATELYHAYLAELRRVNPTQTRQ